MTNPNPLAAVLREHPYRGIDACDCGNGLHWRALCACEPLVTWTDTIDAAYEDWIAHVVPLLAAAQRPQYQTTDPAELARMVSR